jgi:hypothetical protein
LSNCTIALLQDRSNEDGQLAPGFSQGDRIAEVVKDLAYLDQTHINFVAIVVDAGKGNQQICLVSKPNSQGHRGE